jgi:hypothetical protein
MKKYILFIFTTISLIFTVACKFSGVGGAGWDDKGDIEIAKQYPIIESNRVVISREEVPYQTFKQEFDGVFQDFPYHGKLTSDSSEISKTQIVGTPYYFSYENFALKFFRDNDVIAERTLPKVFYMHPISLAVIIGKSRAEDRILCRTYSRATTGLHYVFIADGNGDILFEKVMGASEDWDILPGNFGEIIIGGAYTKMVISQRQ